MKALTVVMALALLLWSGPTYGQKSTRATPAPDRSLVLGVWRAELDGLPAVALVITDEGGGLSGAALFYLHMRKTANDPYTATPHLPEPLLNPRFDGKTLTFEISHRRAHPPGSLSDPPMTFTLTLTGPNQAELVNRSEKGGPAATLTRSDE